jgi:hypothetical protein
MDIDFENMRMLTLVEKIRPLPGGACYEAKVTNIYGSDGEEILNPAYPEYWGFSWGMTSKEASQQAEQMALEKLKNPSLRKD